MSGMINTERAPSPPASTAACDISIPRVVSDSTLLTSNPSPHEARFGKTDLLRRFTVLGPVNAPEAEVLTQHPDKQNLQPTYQALSHKSIFDLQRHFRTSYTFRIERYSNSN